MKKILHIAILFLVCYNSACAQIIYVATNGSNANPGTSPNFPKQTIYAAALACPAGGKVLISGGEYLETLDIPLNNPITITRATASDVVVINSQNHIGTSFKSVFVISSAHDVTISYLTMKNLVGTDASNAVNITGGYNISIIGCSFENIGWTNDITALPTLQSCSAIKARNGSSIEINNLIIRKTHVFNCAVGRGEAITVSGNVNGFIVDSNIVHDISNIGIDIHGNGQIVSDPNAVRYRARNGIVKNNTVYHCMSRLAESAGIYFDGAENCIAEANYVYQNGIGISVGTEEIYSLIPRSNIVRNNMISDNSYGGMVIGAPPGNLIRNTIVIGNSFFQNSTMRKVNGYGYDNVNLTDSLFRGEIAFQNADTVLLQNNIFYRRDFRRCWYVRGSYAVNHFTADYDDYFPDPLTGEPTISIDGAYFNSATMQAMSYASLDIFRQQYPSLETAALKENPMFTDTLNRDFSLVLSSPLINKGNPATTTAEAGLTDFSGFVRIQCSRVDMGAREAAPAVPPAPTVTPANPGPACFGQTILLNSSAATGNQWYIGTTSIAGATGNTYAAAQTGSYSVIASVNGCSSAASSPVNVIINPLPAAPVITTVGPVSFCEGDSVRMISGYNSGNQWYRDGTPVAGAVSPQFYAKLTGTYTVKVTVGSCPAAPSNSVAVSVTPAPPVPSINPSNPGPRCFGQVLVLTSSAPAGNQWYSSTTPIAGANASVYQPTQTGNYKSVVTVNGCSTSSAPVIVSFVSQPAAPVITLSGSPIFCEGDSAKLLSGYASGNQWYRDGNLINGAANAVFYAKISGTYTARYNTGNCTSNLSNSIVITVNQKPAIPFISLSGSTLQTQAGYSMYQWALAGNAIAGANQAAYNAGAAYGIYSVRVTNNVGCDTVSAAFNYAPPPTAPDAIAVTLLTNPVRNTIRVKVTGNLQSLMQAVPCNGLGQMLAVATMYNGINDIDVSGLAPGHYVLRVFYANSKPLSLPFLVLR